MLTEKEKKPCRMLLFEYKRKLKKFIFHNTTLSAHDIVREYIVEKILITKTSHT